MTSPRSLRWGILFIAAGILWLLVSNDTISHSVFYFLLALWPVLLIAIGIELIFRRTRLHALAYASPLIIALAVFFAGREAYFVEQGDRGGRRGGFVQEVGEVETLQAVIELGDYNLFVRARADNKLRGYMSGHRARPIIDYTQSNSSGLFEVKDNPRWLTWDWDVLPNVHLTGRRWRDPELRVDLPQDKLVSLQLYGDDSEVDLNLAALSLKELIARVNEVSLSLEIGAAEPLVDVTLAGTGNRLRLNMPNGAGLRIDGVGITSDLSSLGLERIEGIYTTPGYDTLSPQINVHLDNDLERLTLKTY